VHPDGLIACQRGKKEAARRKDFEYTEREQETERRKGEKGSLVLPAE